MDESLEREIFGGEESDLEELSDLGDLNEEEFENELATPVKAPVPAAAKKVKKQQKPAVDSQIEDDNVEEDQDFRPESDGARRKRPTDRRQDRLEKRKREKKRKERRVSEPGDVQEQPQVSEAMREFLDTVDSLKPKRMKKDQFDEADADEAIIRIINEMRIAVHDDLKSNQNKEPAFAKLKLLPKVIGLLEKSYLHDQILEHEMLDAVRSWLEPLPDGSLPAINIRRALLQALQKMPITMDNLRECRLGRVIMFEYQCEKELPELRKIAGDLISQWTRPLLNRVMERSRPQQMDYRRRDSEDAGDADRMRAGELNYNSKHARIPQSIRATYSVKPRSMVDTSDMKDKNVSKFKKMSQQLNRPKAKGESRMNKVSVEGRGMQ